MPSQGASAVPTTCPGAPFQMNEGAASNYDCGLRQQQWTTLLPGFIQWWPRISGHGIRNWKDIL